MFGTFTGNARRPRNVNLSGQAGNSFANTAWNPSVVSNATKAVSNAQAEREKRHAERQRLRAAGSIQRTWRGHRARRNLGDSRRATFDALYSTASHADISLEPEQRLPQAFKLLLSFFASRRRDDYHRLLLFVHDTETSDLSRIAPADVHSSRTRRLVDILVEALDRAASEGDTSSEPQLLLKLIIRMISDSPRTLYSSRNAYFAALAKLCRLRTTAPDFPQLLISAISTPLTTGLDKEAENYAAVAFHFLNHDNLHVLEENIALISRALEVPKLAAAIVDGYTAGLAAAVTKDELLWLLAHFIDLGRITLSSSHKFIYLETLYTQLCALSSEISIRVGTKALSGSSPDETNGDSAGPSVEPYVSGQLLSLVDDDGISRILRDFSENLASSSNQEFRGTSLLAGFILTLLLCFPGSADDTRMRLFLEQIPTPAGEIPTIKFLWQIMRQTTVFRKLLTESERPVDVLRNYLGGSRPSSRGEVEEQEWRIILLFLELYIFILRLSDDEDFFSGIFPSVLDNNSPSSRARTCSLSLEDVKALTVFLKTTAFALHYKAREISTTQQAIQTAAKFRLDSYLGSSARPPQGSDAPTSAEIPISSVVSTKLDLDSLRGIVTTAMKMLYERDSRKQFLPAGHWLMTDKLDQEDFIGAVITEEKRQRLEDENDSDDEKELGVDAADDDGDGFYSTFAAHRLSRHARTERMRAMQIRAQKERRLAEMGPKLEILKHMPFAVPFETRVKIFREFIFLDQFRRNETSPFLNPFSRHVAKIRRGKLFDDAYRNFYEVGEGLKDPIHITFIDRFNTPEAGIDGGGVTKEFLTSVISEAFGKGDDDLGMFTSSETGLMYPDPTAMDRLRESLRRKGLTEADPEWREAITNLLKRFEFLGRIFGKCMYDGVLVDVAFAGFFLLKWPTSSPKEENSYKGSVNDLKDMDEELYNGLLRLKNYPGDISDLGIDFTITDRISEANAPVKTVTRKLIPNGDQVYVTNDNRLLYNSYVARHRLVLQPAMQTSAFLRGLRAIIRPSWISMFNQSELQRLIGGDSMEIDIEDLRCNTVYSGLYEIGDDNEEHPTIKLFWKVMAKFTDEERRSVVKYVSSTPRAPLLGFSQLNPKFSIRDSGADEARLPSASTCVNLLKLPRYSTEKTLREKLLYAVESGAGFDLS